MSDFDPEAYAKQSDYADFNPHEYLAGGQPPASAGPGEARSALDHFANSASMGYLPQLQAIASKIADKVLPNPGAAEDEKLKAQGFNISGPPEKSYVQERDDAIARLAQEGKENPISSAAGTIGGLVNGGILMGAVAPARAATAVGRIVQGVKTGAAMAAVANPGDTEGQIDPTQLGDRVDNAKKGALVGGLVSGAIEAAPHVLNGIKFAGNKVASALSGVSDDVISRYAERTDQINNMIKSSGGDMTEAADQVRQQAQNALRSTRSQLSGQIGKALQAAPKDPVADVGPIKDQLTKVLDRLNPNLQSEAVNQIKDTISKLETEAADNGGKVSVQQLNQITDFLQGRAKSAYLSGGQIFQNAKEAAQASKGAAAVSRKILNELSPDIAEANNKLALLHNLEDKLNPNLIKPGAPDSALFSAGAGNNPRNAKVLQMIGDSTGFPILDKAQDLSAAREFASPSILPHYTTGKSVAGLALTAGAAHLAGPVGYAVGAAASPAAIKAGINVANKAAPIANAVGNFIQQNPAISQRFAQNFTTPTQNQKAQDQGIDERTLGIFKSNPDLIDGISNPAIKEKILKQINRAPAKGPDAWAQSGLSKLGINDPALSSQLLNDKKAKELLIQASDLSPGSKAMMKIKNQINTQFGVKK